MAMAPPKKPGGGQHVLWPPQNERFLDFDEFFHVFKRPEFGSAIVFFWANEKNALGPPPPLITILTADVLKAIT